MHVLTGFFFAGINESIDRALQSGSSMTHSSSIRPARTSRQPPLKAILPRKKQERKRLFPDR